MSTEHFNQCKEILLELAPKARFWGQYIDEFMSRYRLLSKEERDALNRQVPSSVRFGLLYQYLAHVSRSLDRQEEIDSRAALENMFYLLALDNCEQSYKDTIISLRSALEKLRESYGVTVVSESWEKNRHILPRKVFEKTENTFIELLQGHTF